jgi:anaerobic C4-dicarboxylate transporter
MDGFDDVRSKEDLAREVREGLAEEVERRATEIDTGELAETSVYIFSATTVGIVLIGGAFRLYDWATQNPNH